MGNKNESCRISLAAVNNCVGRVFAAGGAKVVRPERNGYAVHAVVACTKCGQEYTLSVQNLGTLLKYPNEARNWKCQQQDCASRTVAAPASETDVDKMSADEYRASVVEPEHSMRQARAKVAQGVPMEQQREYARIFAGFVLTSPTIEATDSPHYFTRPAFLGMSPQNRAAWVKWAADVVTLEGEKRRQAAANDERLRQLRLKYVHLTAAFKKIRKLDELAKYPLEAYYADTDENRATLDKYADSILGA